MEKAAETGRAWTALFFRKGSRPDAKSRSQNFPNYFRPEILSFHRLVSAAFLTVPVVVLHLNMGSRYRPVGAWERTQIENTKRTQVSFQQKETK
jgi:hypothetical protein